MRNSFPKRPSGAPLYTLSKLYDVPVGFVNPSSLWAMYCFICGRRRVAVARYRMICLVLLRSINLLVRILWFCYFYRKCGEITDEVIVASKNSGGMMILTFDSNYVKNRVAERGFRLRLDTVGKGWYNYLKYKRDFYWDLYTILESEQINIFTVCTFLLLISFEYLPDKLKCKIKWSQLR